MNAKIFMTIIRTLKKFKSESINNKPLIERNTLLLLLILLTKTNLEILLQ